MADVLVAICRVPPANRSYDNCTPSTAVYARRNCLAWRARDFAYHFLHDNGIETQVHYQPLYQFDLYKQWLSEMHLPGVEQYYRGCLSIPIYPKLSENDQDYILDILAKCCNQL